MAQVREFVTVEGTIEGIVSTAKVPVPLQDVPITIGTITAERLAEQGVTNLVDALRNVPSVNPFTTYGVYEYYNIRGFLDSVQLVDGVRYEGNRVNTQLTGVDRIEVLKGPASALYGGGALGGTINIVRKRPSAVTSRELVASLGSWGQWRGAFGTSGRLGADNLVYRLDAGADTSDGYRHNGSGRFLLAPTILWRASPRTEVEVAYSFSRDRFNGDSGLPVTGLADDGSASVLDVPRDRNFRTPQDRALSASHNFRASIVHRLSESVVLRNTLAYRHFNDEYFLSEGVTFDAPSTVFRDYLYFHHHRRPLTNTTELVGTIKRAGGHRYVVGWEGQRYHNFTTLPDEDFFSAEPIDAFNPIETQQGSDLTITRANVFTNNTNALYAQDAFGAGDKLKILVGGRYDFYRRSSHSERFDEGTAIAGPVTRRSAEALTSRLGIVFQPTATADIYGSFATSFKPLTLAQPDGTTLEPERGIQFEAGQRLRLLNDRVKLTTAVYRLSRSNVAFRRPGNVYVQAGEVASKGIEADLEAALPNRWQLGIGYGFTHASFLDYEPSVGTNLRGNTPVFAPRNTLSVWSGYRWSNGFAVNAGIRYTGKTFADDENVFAVKGYGVVNAAVRYTRGEVEYAINVNNLTNQKYFVPHQDYLQVYPGDPVNLVATVRLRVK